MSKLTTTGKFWVIADGSNYGIFDREKEAIMEFTKVLKKKKDAQLLRVSMEKERIVAEQVSWKDIAMGLLEGK